MVQSTDPNTGITALSNEVEIKQPQAFVFDFGATPSNAAPGQPIAFETLGTDQPIAFEWQFGDPNAGLQNTSQEPKPTHVFALEGSYTIQLVATDLNGCKHTLLKTDFVEIEKFNGIYLPNAFTPNGDGENDQFRVRGLVNGPFSMIIFNQWGELLFQSENPSTGWDGNRNGLPVQPGTFIYLVKLEVEGKAQEISGKVTLLR